VIIVTNESNKLAWLAVIGGILAAFMVVMDIQITNAAIEKIQNALGASVEEGSWITSSYLLAEIVVIPMGALLMKLLGVRRYAFIFCSLFILSSVLCTFSWNLSSMIFFRIFQGVTGGTLMPLAYTLIMLKLPANDHAKAMSLFSIAASSGPVIGSSLAGVMTEYLGWQSLFLVNVPIGLTALYLMSKGLQNTVHEKLNEINLDKIGLILTILTFGSLGFVLEEGYKEGWFQSPLITFLSIVGITAFVSLIINELLTHEPLVNLRLFKIPLFTIACLANVVAGCAIVSSLFLIPYYLITVQNYSPIAISKVIMIMSISAIITGLLMPKILKLFHHYFLMAVGFGLFAISSLMSGQLTADFAYEEFFIPQLIRGMSISLMMIPLGILATTSVDKQHAPSASILFNILRTLGGAIGVSSLTTYINIMKDNYHATLLQGYTVNSVNDIKLIAEGVLGSIAQLTHAKKYPLNDENTVLLLQQIELQSYTLAFADGFQLLGILLMGTAVVFLSFYLFQLIKQRVRNILNRITTKVVIQDIAGEYS